MNKRLLIFMLLACLKGQVANAQKSFADANSGVTPSKAASAPGGNIYSPDLFSGTVNVTIPIYNYTVDGIDLGVSLSYNTLGIKVDDIASNVGLGWTLNTGGIITREMHGVEDEMTYPEIDTISTLAPAIGVAVEKQKGNWVNGEDTNTLNVYKNPEQPDVFTAVLGGRSIKFAIKDWSGDYAKDTMNVYTSPSRDISVTIFFTDTCLYTGLTNIVGNRNCVPANSVPENIQHYPKDDHILRFKITDEHGNQFFFDRGEWELRDYNYKTFHPVISIGSTALSIPTMWVLSRVVTYTGAIIKYSYTPDSYSYPAYRNQMVSEKLDFLSPPSPMDPGSMQVINEEIFKQIRFNRLTQIEYPNGDVLTFETDALPRLDRIGGSGSLATNNRALASITLKNGYNPTFTNSFKYKFNYAYFNSYAISGMAIYPEAVYPSNSIPDPLYNLRLKLIGIDKTGTDNTTTEPYYTFEYNSTVMPARLSGRTDCYGYYNGKWTQPATITNNPSAFTSLLGQLDNLNIRRHEFKFKDASGDHTCTYGRDKTPDWTYAQAFLLTSIRNGLGARIEFSYKDHYLVNPPDCIGTSASTNTGYFDPTQIYFADGIFPAYHAPTDMEFPNANDGVCIDKITCTDGYNMDNTTITTFDFSNGAGDAGGVRFMPSLYTWYALRLSGLLTAGGMAAHATDNPLVQIIEKIYQNSFVTPMDPIGGANHGYTHARVKTTGYGSDLLSDKEYMFTNLLPLSGETVTYYPAISSIPTATITPTWARIQMPFGRMLHQMPRYFFHKDYMGLIKFVKEYDNAGHVISETINSYNQKVYPDSIKATEDIIIKPSTHLSDVHSPFPKSVVNLIKSISRNYSGSGYTEIVKTYEYDNNNDLVGEWYVDSKGKIVKEVTVYNPLPYQEIYNNPVPMGTAPLRNRNIRHIGAKTTYVNGMVVAHSGMTYTYTAGSKHYYSLGNTGTSPLPPAFFNPYGGIKVYGPMAGDFHYDKVWTLHSNVPVTHATAANGIVAKHYRLFDDHNNVLETGYNEDQSFSASIWDNRIGEKLAEAGNAKYDDIAYTSFEGDFAAFGTDDYNKGNWDFTPGNMVLGTTGSKPMTGRYYYTLTGSAVTSKYAPANGKDYIVSVWYKGVQPYISSFSGATFTDQLTAGGWKLATATITGNGSSHVDIVASGTCSIDEVRMHPVDAAMQTYTYEPLLGVSSSSDERNNITYYEYDAMGRLKIVRDINGNILSLTKSVVQGSDH